MYIYILIWIKYIPTQKCSQLDHPFLVHSRNQPGLLSQFHRSQDGSSFQTWAAFLATASENEHLGSATSRFVVLLQGYTRPGKRLHNYGKSPCFMGKSTINIYKLSFSIATLNYQRVSKMIQNDRLHGPSAVVLLEGIQWSQLKRRLDFNILKETWGREEKELRSF